MQACLCDLCDSGSFRAFPQFITGSHYKVVVCQRCGLIYTNPRWDEVEIDRIYKLEFKADPGAPAVQNSLPVAVPKKNVDGHQAPKKPISLSLITKHIDPKNKKWLEIRFRSGSILKEVKALGAEISGVDLFDNNRKVVGERLNCSTLYSAPIYDFLAPIKDSYDVISMMTIHVLAHVPSPTKVLREIYYRLVPGGLMILDEKDVTRIPPGVTAFPFQYPHGMAHYHHMTLNTTKAFVKKAGFEILRAEYSDRTSSLQHFMILARRPHELHTSSQTPIGRADDPRRIYLRMVGVYISLRVRWWLNLMRTVKSRAKRAFKGMMCVC